MTSAFRCHDTRPAHVSSPLFAQLIDDWIHLNQLATSAIALRRWGQLEPSLFGYRRPADLVDAVDQATSAQQDTVLAALVRLTQSGHQLAGRVLLQLLLPKLGKMALRTGATSSDNAWSEDRRHIIVAEFWDIVAAYPVQRRPSKVAANLVLDTLHRVTNPRGRPADTPLDPTELPQPRRTRAAAAAPGELSVDADLVELVTWAVERHVISSADGRLLCRVYLPHPDQQGSAADHAATALGLTPAAVRQRCSRARRHLVDAVRQDLRTDGASTRLTTAA